MDLLERNYDYIVMVLMVATIAILASNSFRLDGMHATGLVSAESAGSSDGIIPTGVPEVYGEELGVSYDQVSPYNQQLANQVINRLKVLDTGIELDSAQTERYINILYRIGGGISCEYCCGARSVIFENGQAACGCAHSYAMRGIAKYLITEHGDEFTDKEIFEEVAKWKILFFPNQLTQKAGIMEDQGTEVNLVTLTSNQYRGIEKGVSGSGMVGGC